MRTARRHGLTSPVALPRGQWQQAITGTGYRHREQMIFSLQPAAKTAAFAAGGRGLEREASCSSKYCVTRWRNRPRWAWRPARSGITVTTHGRFPARWPRGCRLTGPVSSARAGAFRRHVAWGKRLSPGNLSRRAVVSLYCGAIHNQLLVIFHDQLQKHVFMEHPER